MKTNVNGIFLKQKKENRVAIHIRIYQQVAIDSNGKIKKAPSNVFTKKQKRGHGGEI
jgi:hypothetical protein